MGETIDSRRTGWPSGRRFTDHELGPLRRALSHSCAAGEVNAAIAVALRGLPEFWVRFAGVWLPECSFPVDYLAIGPTGAFIIAPTTGVCVPSGLLALEHAARVLDRLLPPRCSPTRLRLVFARDGLTEGPIAIPGTRRIWLVRAEKLREHLLCHEGNGPSEPDLIALAAAIRPELPALERCDILVGGGPPARGLGLDYPGVTHHRFDD